MRHGSAGMDPARCGDRSGGLAQRKCVLGTFSFSGERATGRRETWMKNGEDGLKTSAPCCRQNLSTVTPADAGATEPIETVGFRLTPEWRMIVGIPCFTTPRAGYTRPIHAGNPLIPAGYKRAGLKTSKMSNSCVTLEMPCFVPLGTRTATPGCKVKSPVPSTHMVAFPANG